jgi:hypothetical protein
VKYFHAGGAIWISLVLAVSLGAMIGGFLLFSYSLTTTFEQPTPVISIVFGLALSVSGFITLVPALKKE